MIRIVSSLAGTSAALYVVLNQDLSHGSHEEEEHALPDKLTTQPEENTQDKPDSDLPSQDPKQDNAAAGGAKVDKEAKNVPEGHTEEDLEGEKNSGRTADIKEDLAKHKGEDSPHATADDKSSDSPDDNDTVRCHSMSFCISKLTGRSPTRASRLATRPTPLASRRVCPTRTPSTPPPSTTTRRRARRARVLPRPRSSRAPSPLSDRGPRATTGERLNRTRTRTTRTARTERTSRMSIDNVALVSQLPTGNWSIALCILRDLYQPLNQPYILPTLRTYKDCETRVVKQIDPSCSYVGGAASSCLCPAAQFSYWGTARTRETYIPSSDRRTIRTGAAFETNILTTRTDRCDRKLLPC